MEKGEGIGMTAHLVQIDSIGKGLEGRRALLRWKKARGVPEPDAPDGPRSKKLLAGGMVCEIDAEDLEEARTFGEVQIIATK